MKLSRRRADGPTNSAGRVASSVSSRPWSSRRCLTPRLRMPAPNPPSQSRQWMLTPPLKRAGSRSRPSAGRGLVSITMRGPTSARTSRPSGRVAGSTPAQVRTCSFPAIRLLPWVMTAEACRMRYVTLLVVQTMQGMRRPQVLRMDRGLRLRPRGVHLGTALTDSGVEDARKRARSACRSTWSLWSRCCCLCNCLDPFRLERTLVRLASLFTPLGLASIATCVAWLLGWF